MAYDFASEYANHLVIQDIINSIDSVKMAIAYLYNLSPSDEDYEYLTPEVERAWSDLAKMCRSFDSFLYWYRFNRPGENNAFQKALDKVASGEPLTDEERALFKNRPSAGRTQPRRTPSLCGWGFFFYLCPIIIIPKFFGKLNLTHFIPRLSRPRRPHTPFFLCFWCLCIPYYFFGFWAVLGLSTTPQNLMG